MGLGGLPEDIFHLLDERGTLRLVVDASQAIQFLKQFPLAFAEFCGRLSTNLHEQVTLPPAVKDRHASVLNAESCARLGSLRNPQGVVALKRGHLDFTAQRRLRERDRDHAMQIVAFARKE
jgi:hypothetical protein